MYATDYFEELVLNAFRGTTANAPAAVYVGLYISNPGDSGGGTEISYSGYARQKITLSAPADISGNLGVQNSSDITFQAPTTNAGTVTYVALFDTVSAGNMLAYAELDEPMSILSGEQPVIAAGEAKWWITGQMCNAYATKVLNLLRGVSMTGIATLYLALFDGDPDDGGTELTGYDYARVALSMGPVSQQGSGAAQISNSERVQSARSTGSWGTWAYTVLVDAATGGQPIYAVERASSKIIGANQMIVVDAGAIKLSLN